MLITQVHIELGCASESQQRLLQRPKDTPKFPGAMTVPVTHWPSPSGPREQPLQATGSQACTVEEAGTTHPIHSPPLAHSYPRYIHTTEVKGSGTPATRGHLGTGHSVGTI